MLNVDLYRPSSCSFENVCEQSISIESRMYTEADESAKTVGNR